MPSVSDGSDGHRLSGQDGRPVVIGGCPVARNLRLFCAIPYETIKSRQLGFRPARHDVCCVVWRLVRELRSIGRHPMDARRDKSPGGDRPKVLVMIPSERLKAVFPAEVSDATRDLPRSSGRLGPLPQIIVAIKAPRTGLRVHRHLHFTSAAAPGSKPNAKVSRSRWGIPSAPATRWTSSKRTPSAGSERILSSRRASLPRPERRSSTKILVRRQATPNRKRSIS
jgi:hypothetical protein